MKTFIVDGHAVNLYELYLKDKEGFTLICKKCNTKLKYAFTREAAANQEMAPGIYCTKNLNHINVHLTLVSDEMREFMNRPREKPKKSD